jgi:hypothetical protein
MSHPRISVGFALAALFLGAVIITISARGFDDASPGETSLALLTSDPARSELRFGADQPVLAYSPFAITPPAPPPATLESPYAFIWPNSHHLVQGVWAGHPLGIDIGAPEGDPVLAVRDGRVVFAGGDACCNYGLFVIIEHDEGWSSLYAHFSNIDVRAGDDVKQGQVLGQAGGTGKVTGPHLHFELRHNGSIVNPLDFLEPFIDWSVTAELIAEFEADPTMPATDPATAGQAPSFAGAAAGDAPPTDAPPASRPSDVDASSAIALASAWLANQEDSVYSIDQASCVAAQSGPNWWVTCDGRLQGCRGVACAAQLTACVFDQPRMVTAACP